MRILVSQIKRKIEAFASYLPRIADQEPSVFEKQLHKKLQHIEAMSLIYPDQRQYLMKFCFVMCAEELDVSALFQHSRYKPLGYAGDYLAVALIKWMWSWTRDGGKIMIGNAHPRNPSRNIMEWCADWRLIHRTQADMLRLCEQADIPHTCVAFAQEPLGINIFCMVTRPTSLQRKG